LKEIDSTHFRLSELLESNPGHLGGQQYDIIVYLKEICMLYKVRCLWLNMLNMFLGV